MQSEKLNALDVSAVGVLRNTDLDESLGATGVYTVECVGADGQVKWSETLKNLVVTSGKNDLLDKYFAG